MMYIIIIYVYSYDIHEDRRVFSFLESVALKRAVLLCFVVADDAVKYVLTWSWCTW